MNIDATWLLLDTSAPTACVGVLSRGQVRSKVQLDEPRRHAEALPGAIAQALQRAALSMEAVSAVAVGRGPGSFVGVRVGIATAKGIALSRRIPLVGVGTLVALAGTEGVPDGDGLCVLDARRGELYVQRVRRHAGALTGLDEPRSVRPQEAAALARASDFVVGNGLDLLGNVEVRGPILRVGGPSVQGLARALQARLTEGATDELFPLVPAYCRPPDAKLPEER